jgi:YidC/Oxa1 family membrane protein insertase
LTEYQNPQNDPGAQKRLMLAFLLVFVMIAAMRFLMPSPQPPQQPQQTPTPQQQASPTGTSATAPAAAPSPKRSPAAAPKVPAKQAATESESILENENYRIVFTNHGAVAKSWVLKSYKDEKGRPLDLVNSLAAPALGHPLSFFAYDKDLEKKLNDAMYVVGVQSTPGTITFEYSDGEITARKTLRTDQAYVIALETEVTRNGQRVTAFPQWPGGLGDQTSLSGFAASRLDWYQDGNVERNAPTSGWFLTGGKKWVADGKTVNGPFQWAGLGDRYFFAAFMPQSPKDTALVTLNSPLEVPKDPSNPNDKETAKVAALGLAFGHTAGVTRVRVFAGPKAVDVLDNTHAQPGGPDLRATLDFGFFGFIARPLFLWLRWTYIHWIPNWGWAIAFLTVVITMALLPLRVASMKSSLKMQKIQPQVKAITEKYKRYSITDPRRQEMQKEMSELYKKEGVNPVGGCFPMLLQMPFLFAFYSMLGNVIDLRLANWLWIKDLSAADPLHILPIIIVVTMFVMQKSTPQAGMDPTQQKMLNVMGPLMIGYISWFVAAGLCIYWAISNLLGYVQQLVINRSELGQQVRKAQERRATRKK